MERVSEHVWWMPPAKPDRPSLCAVVGERWTLMLDAGSSWAHARSFLAGLPARPRAVMLTHSHWDHVFGAVEVGALVVAERRTVPRLAELARRDWSDEGLDGYRYAADIKEELPAPRLVEIAPVDVVFDGTLDLDLGGVRVEVRHVASDHCDDACVAFVPEDRLLFLGDALCAAPGDALTRELALPLYDAVAAYDAELVVEGHHPAVSTRGELAAYLALARAAADGQVTADDEDSEYLAAAFARGVRGPSTAGTAP